MNLFHNFIHFCVLRRKSTKIIPHTQVFCKKSYKKLTFYGNINISKFALPVLSPAQTGIMYYLVMYNVLFMDYFFRLVEFLCGANLVPQRNCLDITICDFHSIICIVCMLICMCDNISIGSAKLLLFAHIHNTRDMRI